jgi:predicted phosphodiesterase
MKRMIQRRWSYLVVLLLFLPCHSFSQTVKFAVIADIHQGYLNDVNERLQVFLNKVKREEQLDFIIQLGDFILNPKHAQSRTFLDLWNTFDGPKYHVLGNHDLDRADKAQVRAFWGMPADYYSFDLKGFRFIVLDGNHIKTGPDDYRDYEHGNCYAHKARGYFGPQQLQWFKNHVDETDLHVVSFSHQRLSHRADGPDMRKAIEHANAKAGFGKFILSLNGHGHSDLSELVNQVPYVEIPTAAHKWEGKAIPYTTVRFAIVTLDAKGVIEMNARSIEFEYQNKGRGEFAVGSIIDKTFNFTPKP